MSKTVQIRDLDDETYRGLTMRAAEAGLSVPEFLRQEAERIEWIVRAAQQYLALLPEEYPQFISPTMVDSLFLQLSGETTKVTQWLVSLSLESIPGLVALLIYLVLAAQFHSFRDPLIVLLGSVPLAISGALLASMLDHATGDVAASLQPQRNDARKAELLAIGRVHLSQHQRLRRVK